MLLSELSNYTALMNTRLTFVELKIANSGGSSEGGQMMMSASTSEHDHIKEAIHTAVSNEV